MVVCQFFLQGKCHYGEKCRNEHPRGGAQRSLFGGGGDTWSGGGQRVTFRDSFGTAGNQGGGLNPYKWSSGAPDTQGSTPLDLVNNLAKDIERWESSQMWPFSCIAVDSGTQSLPEFYDVSIEELRLQAYEAQKSGNIHPYIEKVQTLTSEFQSKRSQFKHMSADVKQKLVAFIEESRRKKASSSPVGLFGNNQSSSTLFGNNQSSSNLFGQTSGSSSSNNPFGQTTQGQSGNSTSLFGKPLSGSGFGSAGSSTGEGSSVFGSSGLFGKSQSSGSVFGGQTSTAIGSMQSQSSSANPFQSGSTGNQMTTPSLFGNQNTANQPGSVFGQANLANSQQSGTFGSPQSSASQGLFGKTAPGTSASTFSFTSAQQGNNNTSVFGQTSQTVADSTSSSIFGQPSQPRQTLFGKPVPAAAPAGQPQSLLGNPPQSLLGNPPQSLLGNPPQSLLGNPPQSLLGNPPPFGSASNQAAAPTNAAANPGRYTPLEDLTEVEKAEFKASSFTIGRIPLRPPPREMINL